jgi:pyruvate dehydrogenase E1 component alpha subunit
MNPVAVAKIMDKAIKLARSGGGPSFIEMKTYRYRGHSMSDAQHYRTKDEVEEYRKIDPISQVKEVILSKKYATQIELDLVDKSIKERVAECEKFAESSPYPDLTLMYDAVYEQENYPFIKHKL